MTKAHIQNLAGLHRWGLTIRDAKLVDTEEAEAWPEFTDVPGLRRNYGIKRSLAYKLLAGGLIRGVSLRQPGALRGKRLFHVGSVRSYLFSQLEAQLGTEGATEHAAKLAPARKAAAVPRREKVTGAPAPRAKGEALKKSPALTGKAAAKKIEA